MHVHSGVLLLGLSLAWQLNAAVGTDAQVTQRVHYDIAGLRFFVRDAHTAADAAGESVAIGESAVNSSSPLLCEPGEYY